MTKPIQLLAAWLIGLILVNGSFLTTAGLLEQGSWERILLVIASVINVPLFLIAMFLLQTRFRPELQEDLFYSQYLDKRTNTIVAVPKDDKIESELTFIKNELLSLRSFSIAKPNEEEEKKHDLNRKSLSTMWKVSINDYLDNFTKIKARLKEENIPVSSIFGSAMSGKPKHTVLAFSRRVDFEFKIRMILLASEWEFDSYSYYDVLDEEQIEDDILIGSYGHGEMPITPELIDLLKSNIDSIDLEHFERIIRKPLQKVSNKAKEKI